MKAETLLPPVDIDALLGEAPPPCPTGYYLHEDGSLFDAFGLNAEISQELRLFVAASSRETWKKLLPFMRDYLAFRMPDDEFAPDLVSEPRNNAVARQRAYYRANGWTLKTPRAFDRAIATRHPNAGYERFRRLAVHKFYDILYMADARPDNPTYVAGWDEADLQTRTSAANLVSNNEYDARHAGRIFLAPPVSDNTSIPVDPRVCSAQLAEDLDRAIAPSDVIDFDDVMDANGCRPFSVLTSTAFGWAQGGLDDEILVRNKRRGEALELTIVMPPHVLERLRDRLSRTPSPLDPGNSLLAEVERAADYLARPSMAPAAEAFLRSVPLFVSERTGRARTYEGARYHYIKGRRARLALLDSAPAEGIEKPASAQRFSDGLRQPVMSDHRRCSITVDTFKVLAETRNEEERQRGHMRVAANHGQSTDQSARYAAFAYLEEERARRRIEIAEKRVRLASLRERKSGPNLGNQFESDEARGQAVFLGERPD